jgi:hypothetical protein
LRKSADAKNDCGTTLCTPPTILVRRPAQAHTWVCQAERELETKDCLVDRFLRHRANAFSDASHGTVQKLEALVRNQPEIVSLPLSVCQRFDDEGCDRNFHDHRGTVIVSEPCFANFGDACVELRVFAHCIQDTTAFQPTVGRFGSKLGTQELRSSRDESDLQFLRPNFPKESCGGPQISLEGVCIPLFQLSKVRDGDGTCRRALSLGRKPETKNTYAIKLYMTLFRTYGCSEH